MPSLQHQLPVAGIFPLCASSGPMHVLWLMESLIGLSFHMQASYPGMGEKNDEMSPLLTSIDNGSVSYGGLPSPLLRSTEVTPERDKSDSTVQLMGRPYTPVPHSFNYVKDVKPKVVSRQLPHKDYDVSTERMVVIIKPLSLFSLGWASSMQAQGTVHIKISTCNLDALAFKCHRLLISHYFLLGVLTGIAV